MQGLKREITLSIKCDQKKNLAIPITTVYNNLGAFEKM